MLSVQSFLLLTFIFVVIVVVVVLLLQWTMSAMSAIVTRDPVNSALRLFFPQPQPQLQSHPGSDQNDHNLGTTTSSSSLDAVATSLPSSAASVSVAAEMMEMVNCGQSRSQTLLQAASLLLLHHPTPPPSSASALTPSSSSTSSSSSFQQREEVAEEVSGALSAIISALRANTIINTTISDSNRSHLLALSLLVSGGVVETLARLLQQAVHQQPAASTTTNTMSIQSPAVPASAKAEAPLVIARCIRALALLTQDNNNDNNNINNNSNDRDATLLMLDLKGWLRAVSEESIARCVTSSSKQRAGGLLKMLCAVVLRYSHCQHDPPSPIHQSALTAMDGKQEERSLSSLHGGQGLSPGLLCHDADDDDSDEGQRSVAVWGVAVLLDILVCTRRDLAEASGRRSLSHYIQLAGNVNSHTDANATTKAVVTATSPIPSSSSSWLSGVGDGGDDGMRARAQAASGVRGKLLQGGVATSLSAVLRAHIDAVVKCEHLLNANKSIQRDQQLWPSTAATAMAARAMGLLLTLTLHSTPSTTASSDSRPSPSSTASTESIGANSSSSLGCLLGQGTRAVVDLDSNSTSTLAAHTSLRKVGN